MTTPRNGRRPAPPASPAPAADPRAAVIQRNLGIAIITSKPGCCHACDVLASIRDLMADLLVVEAAAPPGG